ncbi:MAG: Fe-S cluster assembly protein SufB [Candidatus Moraniibacteriota bacterium]|nr:MAG: Fe-S cluster assembly protein SufB [Candidatus Moranbacteria bacterium]
MTQNNFHNTSELSRTNDYDFAMPDTSVHHTPPGISEDIVTHISQYKEEDTWMRDKRLHAYEIFHQKPLPTWGPDLSHINFDDITYFRRATDTQKHSWDDLPPEIRETYDRIGVPEHEKDWLAGVSAQYDSEVVYESMTKELEAQGVIFCDMDTAVAQHPDIVKKYFGTLIPPTDNTFAALNSAVWSGGSFIYVPKNTHVKMPLQAYFRINADRFGQFERTLIIADEGASMHYIEGCTAPAYSTQSLHAAVVEIFALKDAKVRYSTIQNWSTNIYNLVTKRAKAEKNATVEWIDCNLGSGVTMKYPSVILAGEGARGDVISMALANSNQILDTGAKMIHIASNTTSNIISKSISINGGISNYRGLIQVVNNAYNTKSYTQCDAMLLDNISESNTYPTMDIKNDSSSISHEASIENLDQDKLFYFMSRGLTEAQARSMMINGFIEKITKEIPLEYSVELYRLINLEMERSIG